MLKVIRDCSAVNAYWKGFPAGFDLHFSRVDVDKEA
jgi:hypothetical protein